MSEEDLGLRGLTNVEMGFLRTRRNYGGAIVLRFLKMGVDAAALDLDTPDEADLTMKRIRKTIKQAGLDRYIQTYVQGKVLIISRPLGAETLTLTSEQEAKLQ